MDELTHATRAYAKRHEVQGMDDAKDCVQPVVEAIRCGIEMLDRRFEISRIDFTGSVYQKVKINRPDEFDFDFPIARLKIENIEDTRPGSSDGKCCQQILSI